MKSTGPSRVVPAGSAGIQSQGWQKQWGLEIIRSRNHATLDFGMIKLWA